MIKASEERNDARHRGPMTMGSRMADNRNTLAVVAAAATLALVLGFAYGATFNGGCEQIKDAQFG